MGRDRETERERDKTERQREREMGARRGRKYSCSTENLRRDCIYINELLQTAGGY